MTKVVSADGGTFASDLLTVTNRLGRRIGLGLQQPSGSWSQGYTYDAAGRLSTLTSPAGTFSYVYTNFTGIGTPGSLIARLQLPNTSYITNTFDSVARTTGTRLNTSAHALLNCSTCTNTPTTPPASASCPPAPMRPPRPGTGASATPMTTPASGLQQKVSPKMSLPDYIDCNLRRELHFRIHGRDARGLLSIGGVRRKPASGKLSECWACAFSLGEIHPGNAEICGEDPLDAFLNCTRFAHRLIQNHKELGWQVWWLEEGDDGGLDAVFFGK